MLFILCKLGRRKKLKAAFRTNLQRHSAVTLHLWGHAKKKCLSANAATNPSLVWRRCKIFLAFCRHTTVFNGDHCLAQIYICDCLSLLGLAAPAVWSAPGFCSGRLKLQRAGRPRGRDAPVLCPPFGSTAGWNPVPVSFSHSIEMSSSCDS